MKKLMIAAATTAIAGGVFGATAQVYDMTLTVKATTCEPVKKAYKNVCAEDILVYRKQTTQKFYGKFWGCGCEVIACPDNYGRPRELDTKSFMFWGKSAAFHNAAMKWSLLQLVGQKGTNIEGAFDLELYTCADGIADSDAAYVLNGAGYGTATVKACADVDNSIKSMSGNVVGTYSITKTADVNGCKYCSVASDCTPWDFCDTCGTSDKDLSAAFGSFTIKYNASQAKKLAAGKWIDEANKFSKFVTDEFACIAAEGAAPEVTPGSSAQATYKNALANFVAASNALEAVYAEQEDLKKAAAQTKKGRELKAALDVADADVASTGNALLKAQTSYAKFGTSGVTTDSGLEVSGACKNLYDQMNAFDKATKDLKDAEEEKSKADTVAKRDAADKKITTATNALDKLNAVIPVARENVKKDAAGKDLTGVALKTAEELLAEFDATRDAYLKAEEAKEAADKVRDEAKKANDTWLYGKVTEEGSYLKAKQEIDDKVDEAEDARDLAWTALKVAETGCDLAGATCK